MDESLIDFVNVDEIDEELIPLLIELNEKNWVTTFSCSGHKEEIENEGRWNAYIAFHLDNKVAPPNVPLYSLKKSKNKYSEKKELGNYNGYFYYWYGDKNKSIEESEEERKQLMADLLDWAKKLPVNDKYEASTYIKDGWVICDGMKLFEVELFNE
jgi:hypothetical protein